MYPNIRRNIRHHNKNEVLEKGSNNHAFITRWRPQTISTCSLAECSEVAVADQSEGVLRTRSTRWRARRPWPRTTRVAGSTEPYYLLMRNTVRTYHWNREWTQGDVWRRFRHCGNYCMPRELVYILIFGIHIRWFVSIQSCQYSIAFGLQKFKPVIKLPFYFCTLIL